MSSLYSNLLTARSLRNFSQWIKTNQNHRTANISTITSSPFYFLRQWLLKPFLPIWEIVMAYFPLVYTKIWFIAFLFSLFWNIFFSYFMHKLMLNITFSWIVQQPMRKLKYNALASDSHDRRNYSLLMSTEGPFVASQEIQGTVLFKLVSIIFIKGYELLHVLCKVKP